MKKQHIIFDCEIIGLRKPVFLVCAECVETKVQFAFWHHKRNDMKELANLLRHPAYTWVGFNSENFDRPLIAIATVMQGSAHDIKTVATAIINERKKSWQTYKEFSIPFLEYDHVDLFEVAPGVMISLKTYAGRLGYKTMVDLPIHFDTDLTPKQMKIVEEYCFNDIGVTKALFQALKTEIELRNGLTAEYGIDLRSKSDAQIAEAILKSRVGIGKSHAFIPRSVEYKAPPFIVTRSPAIKELQTMLSSFPFEINVMNGSPIAPKFLNEPIVLGQGTYQCGIGGLHSTHDLSMHLEASENVLLSDFDVASYYPNIMLKAGLFPALDGDKGPKFIEEYRHIYEGRIADKRRAQQLAVEIKEIEVISKSSQERNSLQKKLKQLKEERSKYVHDANSKKTTLNGTFGKLGSVYCSFYSPALMLAVTLTGQLNLLCIIYELERIKGVRVRSANTDGILVEHSPATKEAVLAVFAKNSKRTGFNYEETPYATYAAKDVNNYLALTTNGKVKAKGLYAFNDPVLNPLYLMKNPTMDVCTLMVVDYLRDGVLPEKSIKKYKKMKDFVAVRNVKGGGIQHSGYQTVDDWAEIEPGVWRRPQWPSMRASVRRKSRPAPVEEGVGGIDVGRVCRWYMTTESLPPITYVSNGNRVPKTEGAKLCMTLPDKLPNDLNFAWYIAEVYEIFTAIGIKI